MAWNKYIFHYICMNPTSEMLRDLRRKSNSNNGIYNTYIYSLKVLYKIIKVTPTLLEDVSFRSAFEGYGPQSRHGT